MTKPAIPGIAPAFFTVLLFCTGAGMVKAQEVFRDDTATLLNEITVRGYLAEQPLLQTPTSVSVLDGSRLREQADVSLLPAINSVPGVRMEERSPGSYRLSLRGSLLRSPWGVRNVKVYVDEFPLTDAGGNTYLNLVDPKGISRLEVLKGPHGSLFGANSGGALLLDLSGRPGDDRLSGDRLPEDSSLRDSTSLEAGVSGGEYGTVHEHVSLLRRWNRVRLNLNQAFLRSDGYRENSGMRRHYVQVAPRWDYSSGNNLKALAFYADMDYATPGGLNEEQYRSDPRQARPPAGPNPGAVEQQAGIRSRTLFGGLSHEARFSPALRHVASVFGSHTDFENPFITNYEVRDEHNYGFRTYLELREGRREAFRWRWFLGLEWQHSRHLITNFDNDGAATKGDLQASDEIGTTQYFYFTRLTADLSERLRLEAALSLNHYRYTFEDLTSGETVPENADPESGSPDAGPEADAPGNGAPGATGNARGERRFSPEWMPRLSLSWMLGPGVSWRASLSRGYSPPTTAEIRPSNILINTALDAETGWNHETGLRFFSGDGRWQADLSVYYYRMREAIVRRLDEGGNEFFVNAGGTDQTGLESMITAWALQPRSRGLLRGLRLGSSYTYSHFTFRDYRQDEEDYSGNRLTGVPRHVAVTNLSVYFPKDFVLSVQHNYTDRIPLNDANSVYAESYHLVQLKLRWQRQIAGMRSLRLFAGVDNLLNEKYSLGNDINAFGNRFFNAAPLRNFYGGLSVTL